MDDYPWARLRPLPEAVVAWMTLRGLSGVESRLRIGWAPVGLMVATYVKAQRPGCELWMGSRSGQLRFTATGGTLLSSSDPADVRTTHWVKEASSRICELCARPGRGRENPTGVRCDACEYLVGKRAAESLPFPPRLPLTDEAEGAHDVLAEESGLTDIPPGWARQVRSTIRDVKACDAAPSFAVIKLDDHVSMYLTEDGDEDQFAFFTQRLEASTRAICQHCGRVVEVEDHPGVCSGCAAVQARDYTILRAYNDGSDER